MSHRYEFVLNERLGIALPTLEQDWLQYSHAEQEAMIEQWEAIRARIPDRVKELETLIDAAQIQVSQEEDWDLVCDLYAEIFRIASIINDLNIWFNLEQYTTASQIWHDEVLLAEEHYNREKQ